jgi:hypothetical protein
MHPPTSLPSRSVEKASICSIEVTGVAQISSQRQGLEPINPFEPSDRKADEAVRRCHRR